MDNIKGKKIHEARKNAGLTLEELGKRVGVSKATIKRYETGEISNIPSDRIESIAQATGVSESFIMGWEHLKSENAEFHASVLKDFELLEMIRKYKSLSPSGQQLVKNMIDELSAKKD